jgi:hypothetical protein
MNTMNTSLADLAGSDAWSTTQEPSTLFTMDDGAEVAFLYSHYTLATRQGDRLAIHWQKVRIEVIGPKSGDLLRDFCKGRATHIRRDGVDILSVKMVTT